MPLIRRGIAGIAGLAGATGLLACIAGVVGCWMLYAEIRERVDRVFSRVEESLGRADGELSEVRGRLGQTRQELDAIRRREGELGAHPPADRDTHRRISRKAAEDASPQLGEARRKLVAATEIALVANGLLAALGELPLSESFGVETGRFREVSDDLNELIGRADKLAEHLARLGAGTDPEGQTVELAGRITGSLDRVDAALAEGASRVTEGRERVKEWHARLTRWLTRAAVILTLVLVWIGAGQLCLMVQGWRSLRAG